MKEASIIRDAFTSAKVSKSKIGIDIKYSLKASIIIISMIFALSMHITSPIDDDQCYILRMAARAVDDANSYSAGTTLRRVSRRLGVSSYKDLPRWKYGAAADMIRRDAAGEP